MILGVDELVCNPSSESHRKVLMILLVRNQGEKGEMIYLRLTSKSQTPALNVIKGDMDIMPIKFQNSRL